MSPVDNAAVDDTRAEHAGDRVVANRIRAAGADGTPLRIVGHGTWLDAGAPVHARDTLSLANDRGVVAYVPGDLIITARAGTTLAELDDALRTHGQWLPWDPLGAATSTTIGAVVATCSYGPLAEWYGTPRDHVLGMTVVTGNGNVIRCGGRVVKNVAGFDVTRLMTGAWGTLGVITQVTLRVRAQTSTSNVTRDTIAHAIVHALAHGASDGTIAHVRRSLPTPYGCREPVVAHPRLATALKRRFDPHGILNPGIMGAL
jgi:FAD/FMN-containing dehydrogenase